jgi:hypothetical protein
MPQTAPILVVQPVELRPADQSGGGKPPVIQNYGAPVVFTASGPITPRP